VQKGIWGMIGASNEAMFCFYLDISLEDLSIKPYFENFFFNHCFIP
jgi:hypothetical protein